MCVLGWEVCVCECVWLRKRLCVFVSRIGSEKEKESGRERHTQDGGVKRRKEEI